MRGSSRDSATIAEAMPPPFTGRCRAASSLALLALTLGARLESAVAQDPPLAPYRDSIPGTLVQFEMVPVPAGGNVKAFWIGRTEVTWDAYDVFAFGLDARSASAGSDAIARPSRPYGAPDYGYGHRGYPAISIARPAAEAFCAWLTARTGKRYRLPTEAEWQRAAEVAVSPAPLTAERRDSLAWHAGNAAGTTHPVGAKVPDALGSYDLFGNAAEWVESADGALVVRGGSYRDPAASIGPGARAVQDGNWNERDPQFPKSRWWLSDGPFVGFRIVREP